jgi:hypothetical protein
MLHDQTDQLACSARKRNQRQRRPRRKRQRLRGREYLARHLRESPVYLRTVRRLLAVAMESVAHTLSALAVAYTIIQS